MSFLGHAAYVQLTIFENLSRVIANAPTTEAKAALSEAAARSLDTYQALVAEIEREHGDVGAAMRTDAPDIDRFQRFTQGNDWFESLITCYVTAGFLDDFFLRVAEGLPQPVGERVTAIFTAPRGEKQLAELLSAAIAANPRLGARLALWGRRLVGDTMLVARAVLRASDNHDSDEARIEPVFSEVIAGHTRRMDALGLTA
nr:ferritin-like fold-containing protein [Galbitalea soli]